jgi:hypothetical protein
MLNQPKTNKLPAVTFHLSFLLKCTRNLKRGKIIKPGWFQNQIETAKRTRFRNGLLFFLNVAISQKVFSLWSYLQKYLMKVKS